MRDGTGKLSTPDSHVDNEDDIKTVVYKSKRKEKPKGEKKEKRKERLKKYNSKKKEFYTIDDTIKA